MSGSVVAPERNELTADNEQLYAVLSRGLERRAPGARIVDLQRAPCPNGTSWWLEEITLDLSDGARIELIFKDLVREANGSGARRVKPAFVADPVREPWVYQNVLIDAAPGPPKYWGALTDVRAGRHWLFIERVNGAPLAQIGDRGAWCAAAEWLGRFHVTAPVRRAARGPLLRHDRKYHRRWLARALSAARNEAEASREGGHGAGETLERLRALESVHERVIESILAASPSLIHGEFYASNVLVDKCGATFATHPVDWEMTALGPPLLDLAALMSGRWGGSDRLSMATAYRDGVRSAGAHAPMLGELLREVTACQLLLAVQWLGWSSNWTAPEGHRNDWLEEAELCARELRR